MASFIADIQKVGIEYMDQTEKGEIVSSEPRAVLKLRSTGQADEHALADTLSEMKGKTVKVTVVLEQGELGV